MAVRMTMTLFRHLSETSRSIPGGDDAGVLNHQDNGPLRRAGSMHDLARDDEALACLQLDAAVFEVNEECPLDRVEEFVVFLVLVPVVLALEYAHAHHRAVHL